MQKNSQSHIDIVSFKLLLLVLLNPNIRNYRSTVQFFLFFLSCYSEQLVSAACGYFYFGFEYTTYE